MTERSDRPARPAKDEPIDFESLVASEYSDLDRDYRSPLVARVAQQRLTVELLAIEIPKVRAGEEALNALSMPARRSQAKTEELAAIKRAGDRAKESLFTAALPLIRAVAGKEWRRRQQWGSQVSLEDLVQEATVGFLKGVAAFKPEAVKRSATNYLGQWMLVEMRRSAETMDHDLQVGHDAGERFRKIRALRSRLLHELGREPTDQEIADASRNPDYLTRPSMLGKAPVGNETGHQPGKGVSEKQVAEERDARTRVGHSARFDAAYGEDGAVSKYANVVDPDRLDVVAEDGVGVDPSASVVDSAARQVISAVILQVVDTIGMPDEQRDILARRYALPPYEEEASAREIARLTGIHRERVTRILNSFSTEMTRPGGVFHRVISQLPADDMDAVGLGWVMQRLGPYDPSVPQTKIPRVLTESKLPKKANPKPTEKTVARGVLAWFACDYHQARFSALYPEVSAIPKTRACPRCSKPSRLLGVSQQNAG